MGRVRKILPQNVVSMLYFTLIFPYLIYCSIIWGGASATALHKLEVLQNSRSAYNPLSVPYIGQSSIQTATYVKILRYSKASNYVIYV